MLAHLKMYKIQEDRTHKLSRYFDREWTSGAWQKFLEMAQVQLSVLCDNEPSMIPISKNESPLGGRVCPFKGCFERRHTYNALRDHLFFHTAFKEKMLEQEDRYENCCENKPTFRNKHIRMLHTFKHCKNAHTNLKHIVSRVWRTIDEYIYNDESWPDEPPY